jgi:hypothetical protein
VADVVQVLLLDGQHQRRPTFAVARVQVAGTMQGCQMVYLQNQKSQFG